MRWVPAPALTYTSLTVTVKPVGAPSLVGSSLSEYWVFDMQMGREAVAASAEYCAIRASAAE